MGNITFVLSWASKAHRSLGVYLSLVALMTIELSDTIKEEPASSIAKTFRNPHVFPRSEANQVETSIWFSHGSFILDQTIKKTDSGAIFVSPQRCSPVNL